MKDQKNLHRVVLPTALSRADHWCLFAALLATSRILRQEVARGFFDVDPMLIAIRELNPGCFERMP
jgi:hypothetical protein